MVNKRNPSIVVATREIFLFVKDVGAFALLWGFSRYPCIGTDVVKTLDKLGVIEFIHSTGRPFQSFSSAACP